MVTGFLFAAILVAQSTAGAQGGTVAGRIHFPGGSPGVGIRVSVWALPENPDQAFLSAQLAMTQTDDQGLYQLENVPPGQYYIGAGRIDGLMYFPGVSDLSRATIVTVNRDIAIIGIDFQIAPLFKVSGKLVTPSGNDHDSRLFARLAASPSSRIRLIDKEGKDLMVTGFSPDGAFEFRDVRPGSYSVMLLTAPAIPIIVVDRDISGLKLGLRNANSTSN